MAKFEILGIEIPIDKFQEYHDDGYVFYIPFMAEELNEYYTGKRGISPCLYALNCNGLTVLHKTVTYPHETKHIHTFYRKASSEPEDLFVRAHEETHAIDLLGKLEFLERVIRKEFKLKKRLRNLEREVKANVGGTYALLARGFPSDKIREIRPDCAYHSLQILGINNRPK